MIPAALLAPLFVFSSVQPWKWSAGRQENIPALHATLDNQSGQEWAVARFRVAIDCRSGGQRTYNITLRDVLLGPRTVDETAFDAIGQVAPCDGEAHVEFLDGHPYTPAERPTFIVLGFSYEDGDAPPSIDLEGILDHRRRSDSDVSTTPLYWRGAGERIPGVGAPSTAYYAFRVEPGRFGLSGFLLSRNPQDTGPLTRFLRFYDLTPGQAAFLGIFRVAKGPGQLVSVTVESGTAGLPSLPLIKGRPLTPPGRP